MSYIPKTISEVVTEYLNRTTFLPAIQREYVWGTYSIEKLFDSIMGDYPISTFLFWKIKEENKNEWTAYEFIREYDKEKPHNKEANVAGVNQDIYLVLDGQQRLTSLLIGLKGSYRYFYYSWHKTKLYLNILKKPTRRDNPEELVYQFQFRDNDQPNPRDPNPQFWYLVGDILNFKTAREARQDIRNRLNDIDTSLQENAVELVEELHSRLFTVPCLNYYEERSQDYDKVVEAFIRANTGGVKLEYSDILLSTATARWENLNAREEIHSFTDSINAIGNGYSFGKDFVLKGCLYLTDDLPIQYQVRNFNRTNLEKIEDNWENIKDNIESAISLVNKFGFNDKNLVTKNALLPIALYLGKLNKKNFVDSTDKKDVDNQILIQKWLILTLLKNAFSGSTDTILKNLQDVILKQDDFDYFPFEALNNRLNIEPSFNETEIDNLLAVNYSTKYSYLILSLLYPDRDWKGKKFEEDHIFPKSEFTTPKLKQRGYNLEQIVEYQKYFNCVSNLELLTDTENREKSAGAFDTWFASRDNNFKDRHFIPTISNYSFDSFLEFYRERKELLKEKLKTMTDHRQITT
jgi:uncharacterized protein with ParB-like and HNH nuclease domain